MKFQCFSCPVVRYGASATPSLLVAHFRSVVPPSALVLSSRGASLAPCALPPRQADLTEWIGLGVASCTAWGAGSAVFRHFTSHSLLASLRAVGSGFTRRPSPPSLLLTSSFGVRRTFSAECILYTFCV